MDIASLAASPLLTVLAWSVVLLVVQIGLQGQLATAEMGLG